jgi:microcystin-dependent protein
VDAPIYSEFAAIPSDSATADVITATTSAQGKTQLASAAPPDIASSGSAGTANATVSNSDHTHKGVTSLSETGDTKLYGDVELEEGANITITRSGQKLNIASTASISGIPVGVIVPFGGPVASIPSGYLYCNGAAVSRTTYATLYGVIGDAHGYGDGSTTFNLPDYRGRFMRGVDNGAGRDPNAGSRTAANTGGNTGDNVGSVQVGATKLPVAGFTNSSASTGISINSAVTGISASTSARAYDGAGNVSDYFSNTPSTVYLHTIDISITDPGHTHGITDPGHTHTISGGDSETRPINAYVVYMIKT